MASSNEMKMTLRERIAMFQETTLRQSKKLAENVESLLQEILGKLPDKSFNDLIEELENKNQGLRQQNQELRDALKDPKEIQNETIQIVLRRILNSESDATLRLKLERLIEVMSFESGYLTPDEIAIKIS